MAGYPPNTTVRVHCFFSTVSIKVPGPPPLPCPFPPLDLSFFSVSLYTPFLFSVPTTLTLLPPPPSHSLSILCTGGVSYAPFILLLISNLFCTKGEGGRGRGRESPPPHPFPPLLGRSKFTLSRWRREGVASGTK